MSALRERHNTGPEAMVLRAPPSGVTSKEPGLRPREAAETVTQKGVKAAGIYCGLTLLLLACFGIWTTYAFAARAWMAPIRITPPDINPSQSTDMAVTSRSEVIATSDHDGLQVAIEQSDGHFAFQQLWETVRQSVVATDGVGGAVIAWETQGNVYTSYRPPGGAFEPAQLVGSGSGRLALGMNQRSDAAVLYPRYNISDSTRQMWGAFRPAGGPFDSPEPVSDTIPTALYTQGSVAVTDSGEAIFAWLRINALGHTELQAAIRSPLGTLGPTQRLSDPQHVVTPPLGALGLEVDQAGNAVLTWNEREPPEDQFGSLWAARRAPGEPFDKAFPLGGTTYSGEGAPVAIAPGGRGAIAWAEKGSRGSRRVQVLSVDLGSGEFADPSPASSASAGGDGIALAVDAQGDAVIFYEYGDNLDNNQGEIRAIRRSFKGEIAAEQPIKCPRSNATLLAAAVDSTGRAVLYWKRAAAGASVNPLFLSQDYKDSTGSPERCAPIRPSPNPALPGETVTFDGSWAYTPDNDDEYALWWWDLDGNGSFETFTGTSPIASRAYDTPGTHWVYMRVEWYHTRVEEYSYGGWSGWRSYFEPFVVEVPSETPAEVGEEESAGTDGAGAEGDSAGTNDSAGTGGSSKSDETQEGRLRDVPVVRVETVERSARSPSQCGAPIGLSVGFVNDSSVDAESAYAELLLDDGLIIESGGASQPIAGGTLAAGERFEIADWTLKQLTPGQREAVIKGYAQGADGAFYQYPHKVTLSCRRYRSRLASQAVQARRGAIVAIGNVTTLKHGALPGGVVKVIAKRVGRRGRITEAVPVRRRRFKARLGACRPGIWKLRARYPGDTGYRPSRTSWSEKVSVSRKQARACRKQRRRSRRRE